jgi:hypothetical protein
MALATGRIRSESSEAIHADGVFWPYARRVMIEYVTFYNEARPHQGIEQQTPIPGQQRSRDGIIQHRVVLGGILHDYYRQAA